MQCHASISSKDLPHPTSKELHDVKTGFIGKSRLHTFYDNILRHVAQREGPQSSNYMTRYSYMSGVTTVISNTLFDVELGQD